MVVFLERLVVFSERLVVFSERLVVFSERLVVFLERLVVFCLAVLEEVWFVDFLLLVVEATAVVMDEEMDGLFVFVVFVCVVELLGAE